MAKRNPFETKTYKIKQHLLEGKSITSWEAFNLYNATRLSGIIFNLKAQGMMIKAENINEEDGTRYAKYSLVNAY